MGSKMSLRARKEFIASIRLKYQGSHWQEKHKILNGLIAATGYQRKYAIGLLNTSDTKCIEKARSKRTLKYGVPVQEALLTVWHAANQICAKRLVPFLPALVEVLERHGHLSLSASVRQQLLSISVATVDRLLSTERQKHGRGISTTKPGSLLKKQIKIRTFADWNDVVPGFLEGDLVAHCGDRVDGAFLNTLVLTDIASGWTEFLPLLIRSSSNVVQGISVILELLPFPLLGVDTDNGSEFINYELLNFCKDHKITFTRSRAYKKNDQAHVEEKNGSIVRRIVGYDRYEGTAAWHALADLYAVLRLYVNYFQPSLKLLSKQRDGSKVTKKYDKAQTPCQRLLNSEHLSEAQKTKLGQAYNRLDPISLLKRLSHCQAIFWQYAWSKQSSQVESTPTDIINATAQAVEDAQRNEDETVNNIISLNRQYRRTNKPRKTMEPRKWRTRKDPFAQVWEKLCIQLELNPHMTAKYLLDQLIIEQPEKFSHKLLRTLQRRVAVWRRQQNNKANQQHMLQLSQEEISHQYLSLVMASASHSITNIVQTKE